MAAARAMPAVIIRMISAAIAGAAPGMGVVRVVVPMVVPSAPTAMSAAMLAMIAVSAMVPLPVRAVADVVAAQEQTQTQRAVKNIQLCRDLFMCLSGQAQCGRHGGSANPVGHFHRCTP